MSEFEFNLDKNIKEIEDNDYNLNIPRYIDTFEAEDNINIDVISNDIKALEMQIDKIDKSIAAFCSELNIATPF
jgi:type I restriction enzyme M protein